MKNMKKRIFCLVMAGVMLSLSISVSAANTSAADPFDHYDDFTIENFAAMDDMTAEQNMIRYFQDQVDNSSYGGIYYNENGVLVVNIVRENYDEFSAVPTTFSDGTSVEYRVVEYSLQELETVKDTLARYMNQYRIAMLDANEMTNQVDVALFNYDSNVRNEILSIAESIHPNIPINFIDYSDCTIQSTVAFEKPEYPADSNILDLV